MVIPARQVVKLLREPLKAPLSPMQEVQRVHCGALRCNVEPKGKVPEPKNGKKHRKIREHIGNPMDIFEVIGGWAGKIIEINSGTWPLYTWFLMDLAIKKDVVFFHSKDLAMESISAGGSRGTWPWKSAEIWGDGNGLKLKTIHKNWSFENETSVSLTGLGYSMLYWDSYFSGLGYCI